MVVYTMLGIHFSGFLYIKVQVALSIISYVRIVWLYTKNRNKLNCIYFVIKFNT